MEHDRENNFILVKSKTEISPHYFILPFKFDLFLSVLLLICDTTHLDIALGKKPDFKLKWNEIFLGLSVCALFLHCFVFFYFTPQMVAFIIGRWPWQEIFMVQDLMTAGR